MLVDDLCFARAQWTVATALKHGMSKKAVGVTSYLCRSVQVIVISLYVVVHLKSVCNSRIEVI